MSVVGVTTNRMIIMVLPNKIKYQNLCFDVLEVDSEFLNGVVSGSKASYIDFRNSKIYVDGGLDEKLKIRCIIMDLIDLACREAAKPMDNVDLVILTGLVMDILESFADNSNNECVGCKNVKYIE